jgi:hypothetical protein
MSDQRVKLSFEDAEKMLDWQKDGSVHAIRQGGPALIGCDWSREEAIACLKKHGAELAGDAATRMGHGIASIDEDGPVFFQTKERGGR